MHVNPVSVRVTVTEGDEIRFNRLSTDAGLSQTRVAQIVQDDRGFMWFGTQYGLNRYDGYKFKVFVPDPSRPDGISGAYIYSLFKDRRGMIWIGCGQYLDRFDPTTESFTHYHLDPPADKGPPATVASISQDRAGILWLATANGLFGLNPLTGRVTQHFSHDPLNPRSLSSNNVTSAAEDRSGRFWVTDGSSLEQLDLRSGKVTLRLALASSPREFSFYEDRSGSLWICYSGGTELASLDPNRQELTRYLFYDGHSREALKANVMTVLRDKGGLLWLGTQGAGLLRFDPEQKTATRYRNHPDDPQSLAEDRIIALDQDGEGNIWVGMHASEPNFFLTKKPSFRPLLREGLNPNSMGEHFVNFIFEDRRGVLWVATTGALLSINRGTGKSRAYLPPGEGLSNDIVAITQDYSGTMWLGTIGAGLNRFDPETGKFTSYRHNPADSSSLSNDAVDHLFVDHTGRMWVGTWDGLNSFDPVSGRFVTYRRSSRVEPVYGIAEDEDGALWLGGTSGLQRFDPQTGKFTGYQHRLNDPNSISDDRVINVLIDRAGTIWATTHSGLNRLERRSDGFTRYFVRDGLPSNRLNCLASDDSGHLWISSTEGLSEFDPTTKKFRNFSVADGLPGMDLSGWSACAKSRTGEMYFGGFSGGTAFYPREVKDSTYMPPVVLTEFQLAGESVGVGGDSPLKRSISYSQSVALSHQQTVFSLEFAALSYSSLATNRYRYKLDGLDSKWHEVGSGQRLVSYNSLPAGEYTFRVQGATSHGPWSDHGASLRIEILPPWWKTWWFTSVFVVAALLSLYAAHSWRIRQVARQFEVRLDARVSERTRIARELHDTLLQSFHGLMLRLHVVDKLMPEGKAKNQLQQTLERADQAIAEGRSAVYDLRTSATTMNDLAEAVDASADELSGESTAGFELTVEGVPRDLHPIVRDELYRICREALRNAFRHARAQHIEAELSYGQRAFRMRIRDDGDGIPAEILEKGRQGHYGLPGIRERARQVGADLTIWSRAGSGTEIELSLAGSIAYGIPPHRSRFHLFRKKVG